MKLLREYIRNLLIEQNVLAQGMCFPFAYQKAEEWFEDHFTPGAPGRAIKRHPDLNNKDKFKVIHGTVTNKWENPPKPVVHGWVEMGDLVFDDQTKHTKPDGIPKDVYYDMYQPEIKKEFTAEESVINCIKYGGEGPWDEELHAQLQQRDTWMNESNLNESRLRGYIKLVVSEDFNLGTATGIEYTALVLDDASHNKLAALVPDGWKTFAHHMTIINPPNQKQRLPSRWLGTEMCVTVNAVAGGGEDDMIMTALVDLGNNPVPMKGPEYPHVTIATNPGKGGKPAMSNWKFKPVIGDERDQFKSIDPIVICGTIEEVLR